MELGLLYEEALTRVARMELNSRLGRSSDADEVEKTNRLLARLGVEQAVVPA
jgi:hypothetical protein